MSGMQDRRRAIAVVGAVSLLLGAPVWAQQPPDEPADAAQAELEVLEVEYVGELIDEDARPLAGVFALEFRLFRDPDATEPIWSEPHFVAVVEGEYAVVLGQTESLPLELVEQELSVGVWFMGQEVLREPMVMTPIIEEEAAEDTTQVDVPMVVQPAMQPGVTEVTFAQVADRALVAEEAERCRDAETLQGHTFEDLDRFDELIERLADHQGDADAHGGGSGRSVRVGRSTTVLPSVGGEGGGAFTRMCPEGYVVVGLRGRSGGMVDAIEVVCGPLE
jgi:hypothetical protein